MLYMRDLSNPDSDLVEQTVTSRCTNEEMGFQNQVGAEDGG